MPALSPEHKQILAAARNYDFSVLESMNNHDLGIIANLQENDESLLWIIVQRKRWHLAHRLIMCGADVGFTKQGLPTDPLTGKKDKDKGVSIIGRLHDLLAVSERTAASIDYAEVRDIKELIEIVRILLSARGQVLSDLEKFDISRWSSGLLERYETLMKKMAAHFPSNPRENYLARMPIVLQFRISQYVLPEWRDYSKQLLTCVYRELDRKCRKGS